MDSCVNSPESEIDGHKTCTKPEVPSSKPDSSSKSEPSAFGFQSSFGLGLCRPALDARDLLYSEVIETRPCITRRYQSPLCARDGSGCAFDSVAAIPACRSPDRHHQAAQHHAHGYEQQPTDAVSHASRSSPLPAFERGPTKSLCGRQLPTLSNRAVSLARAHSPPTGGGLEARLQSTRTDGAFLRYSTLDGPPPSTIRLCQGTLPKAPAPADHRPYGPKRPRVVAPRTARRQGRSPGHATPLKWSDSLYRA